MFALRTLIRFVTRFIIVWAIDAVSLVITVWLLPGMTLTGVPGYPAWIVAMAAAFVLGLVNLLIRPIILLLAVPLGFIVLFVAGFFVNAVTLRLTADLLDEGLTINGWLPAVLAAVVLAIINTLIAELLGIDDAGSFYEGVIQRRLRAQRAQVTESTGRGLVMLEIDGLSYHHIKKAIADGYMPNVRRLMAQQGYRLTRTECGLPSQTSACQAGILFGDNYDIPAFRWYDKARGKLFVSGNDAAEINGRYANGQGLLRGGASVNNMMNGDASLSLLTASDLRGGSSEQKKARAQDVYLLLLNPNFFMRVIGMVIGEALTEVWQYARDVVGGVQPRLNRLHHFYPFVRAITTVFMREVSGYLTLMQIMRGEPAIYTTWPGYDEVAHHSGPWSRHAFSTLRGYDRFIGSAQEIVRTKAPRPYELLLLSDHGQSFGPTFLMRYGYTLKEFIERHMPAGTVVAQTMGGDDGSVSVQSVAIELGNVQAQGMGGRVGQATARQLQRAAETATAARQPDEAPEIAAGTADVTFCGSGNLAQVYFHSFGHRTSLAELEAAFPGLVATVVAHEGVGLVVGLGEDGAPLALGKQGTRDLHSGAVTGDDPLAAYGDAELRAWQVRRVADFPSAGDLILISTLYPDGTVAALEELIGSHGGMGGEQTDSFLLHPADFVLPSLMRNSADLFAALNARRDLPVVAPPVTATRDRDDWAIGNLLGGLRRWRDWAELLVHVLVLDRAAFHTIAALGSMTGPALVISLLGIFIATLVESTGSSLALAVVFAGHYLLWLVTVAVMHGAAHVLRGRAHFSETFRVLGFVQVVNVISLLRLIPGVGWWVSILTALLSLFAAWIGVAEAHRLRGWRTLALPLLYLGFVVAGALVALSMVGGFDFAVETLGRRLGLLP